MMFEQTTNKKFRKKNDNIFVFFTLVSMAIEENVATVKRVPGQILIKNWLFAKVF
jgi:hypothetical protein